MAFVEILARELKVEIKDGDDWLEIEGVTTINHTPTKTDADTGHFGAAGRARHIVAERGDEFTLTCVYLVDPDTGEIPPGHRALRDLGKKIGYQSLGEFRIIGLGGYGIQFRASANVGQPGGGRNDAGTFDVTLTVTDDITPVEPNGSGGVEG